jgi:hypothetical protein
MKETLDRTSRRRRLIGNALIAIPSLILLGAATAKMAGVPFVVAPLEADGFTGLVPVLAAIELTSAMLLLVRATRALGLGLTSAFLGGAIATHVSHGQPPLQPAFVLALIWMGVWLRHRGVQGMGLRLPDEDPVARATVSTDPQRSIWRFAPWVSRLVLSVATFIFLMIGLRFLRDPIGSAAGLGVSISRGLGTTNLRVVLGAFPIAFAIAIGSCLWSRRFLPLGLRFVAVLLGAALVVRAYGIVVDNTGVASRHVLTAEAIVFGLTTFALSAEAARRRALPS